MSVRTAARALRDWILNPVTWVATVLVAFAAGVALLLAPAHGDVAEPPASIEMARVGGYCAVIVSDVDGSSVWALAPGSRDGELRRVDAADVKRDAAECTQVALRPARTGMAIPCEASKPCLDGGAPARPR